MHHGRTWIALAATIFVGAAAIGQGTPAAAPPAADVIAGRQAALRLSAATFGSMKGAIDRGDDVKSQASAARALTSWARALPGMFPAGSNGAPTHALPTVWSDRAGFERAAAAYAAAADTLATVAAAGDKPGFAAQWAVTRKTCGACHDSYRKE